MRNDLRGVLSYRLHFKNEALMCFFLTAYMKCICFLKNIEVGSGLKFYGKALIVRHPNSKIIIGNNCRFRSGANTNLIGITKKCILSTHSDTSSLYLGDGGGFSGVSISAFTSVSIGKNVLIGANSTITDFDWHNIDPTKRQLPVTSGKPVVIKDNVFIGFSVTILKGVTIGENSVIGANSVVTSSIPANCIAVGNPCKVISQINTIC